MFVAAASGHEAVVRLLIDEGADAIAADKDGQMPLYVVAENRYKAVARLLRDRGAARTQPIIAHSSTSSL